MIIRAKFASKCWVCRSRVGKGENIWYDGRARHPDCDPDAQLAEDEDDGFDPSRYQQAIFDWVRDGEGNAFVSAVAGSGKTTTIVRALRSLHGRVLFLAFNRRIAQELAERAPAGVDVMTLNGLGHRSVMRAGKIGSVGAGTVARKRCKQYQEGLGLDIWSEANREARKAAERIIALAKATLSDIGEDREFYELLERYEIEIENSKQEEHARKMALYVLRAQQATLNTEEIDYDDQVWLPVVHGLPVAQYDWVLIDEAQDLSRCQIELVGKAVRQSGRVIAVGDRAQSIYGFRGAHLEAVEDIIDAFEMIELPLSVCYRCPTSVVEMAKTWVPDIEACDGAEEGAVVVSEAKDRDAAIMASTSGDMILCRTNAPLVPVCYALIKSGEKATIMGRDIGKGLVSLVESLGSTSIDELLEDLDLWHTAEYSRLEKLERSTQAIDDKYDCLREFAAGCSTIGSLVDEINAIFQDDVAGVVLSSIHRAKGLEADHVKILRPDLLPHPKARNRQQEDNLAYVACTRARKTLTYIAGMGE